MRNETELKNKIAICENLEYNERFVYYTRDVGEGVILSGLERKLFDHLYRLSTQGRLVLVQKVVYRFAGSCKTEYLAIGADKEYKALAPVAFAR